MAPGRQTSSSLSVNMLQSGTGKNQATWMWMCYGTCRHWATQVQMCYGVVQVGTKLSGC